MNLLRAFFLISLVLTGFFSGIGFVNAIGLIPATEDTSVQHWVPYWQALDRYMRARMPILGIGMLLTILTTLVLVARQKPVNRPALWLAAASLSMVIGDLAVAFSMNLPVNETHQALDARNVPASFESQKLKAVQAFYLRSVPMMLSSVLMILAYFQFETAHARSAGAPAERPLATL